MLVLVHTCNAGNSKMFAFFSFLNALASFGPNLNGFFLNVAEMQFA